MNRSIDRFQIKQKHHIVHGKLHSAQNRAAVSSLPTAAILQILHSFWTSHKPRLYCQAGVQRDVHMQPILKEG